MNIRILLILLGLCSSAAVFGQTNVPAENPWTFADGIQNIDRQVFTEHFPNKSQIVSLDKKSLSSTLHQAPDRYSNSEPVSIQLPLPDGTFQTFQVFETQAMHPDLAAKFPSIRTYAGYSLDAPSVVLRANLNEQGFHAMILGGKNGTSLIEPVAGTDGKTYTTHLKKDSPHQGHWNCHADEVNEHPTKNLATPNAFRSPDCKLRTYRLALACTGEYAQFHGGNPTEVLAAMVTTLNRVNGIFERDLSVTLQLVPNNDEIIFLDPYSDPYSNNNGGDMLDENQTTCDDIIGEANYDIGHVFSTGGGGIAYVGSLCKPGLKAGGVTGSSHPSGDGFDIDYVAHEMGHQFGANHTQNNNCNRYAATSVEPGSGSTVMSYAGVCAPNVQLYSDPYFHAVSIGEIRNQLAGSANSCASVTMVNSCPEADAGADYVIPRSTPFALRGMATDPNSEDELTYCWEQMDNQPAIAPPVASNAAGPAFRSLPPTSSALRFFPNLTALREGMETEWEVLPSKSRTLNFRLTVRDNHPGGGCIAQDDATVTVSEQAGPFRVIQPNSQTSWMSGTSKTISWDVAGTDQAPVNCSHVDILLSLDGGENWPVLLASGTENDGSFEFQVPNYATTQARIIVRSVGNIFFDISDSDLTIEQSTAFSVSVISTDVKCFGGNDGSVSVIASGGSGSYSYQWNDGGHSPNLENLPAGSYSVTVTDGSSTTTATVDISHPEPLTLNLSGLNATQGSNGEVNALAFGGSGNFSYLWNTGSTQPSLGHVTAGNYAVTVTDANGCTASDSLELQGTPPLHFEHGVVENVGEQWQLVDLKFEYENPVVVASIEIPDNSVASVVSRVQVVSGNMFQVRIQPAGNDERVVTPVKIHYLVAEEGVYSQAEHGVQFEAKRIASGKTSHSDNWKFEPQLYQNQYKNPVVLGQVMSYNDSNWSVFWASQNGKSREAPTANSFSMGKHTGEDSNSPRSDEIIGYFAFEAGSGFINGKRFLAGLGSKKVRGTSNALNGFYYSLDGFSETETAIVSAAGMQDGDGHWPVISSGSPTASTLALFAMEDVAKDGERSHSEEQIAYIVFGNESTQETDNQNDISAGAERPDPESYIYAFPNPSNGLVTVEFFQSEAGGPELILSDMFGRMKKAETLIHSEPGFRAVQIDLQDLPIGQYVFQILEGQNRKTIRVIRT